MKQYSREMSIILEILKKTYRFLITYELYQKSQLFVPLCIINNMLDLSTSNFTTIHGFHTFEQLFIHYKSIMIKFITVSGFFDSGTDRSHKYQTSFDYSSSSIFSFGLFYSLKTFSLGKLDLFGNDSSEISGEGIIVSIEIDTILQDPSFEPLSGWSQL